MVCTASLDSFDKLWLTSSKAQPARKKQRTTSPVKQPTHGQPSTSTAATDSPSNDPTKTCEKPLPSKRSGNDAQTKPFRFGRGGREQLTPAGVRGGFYQIDVTDNSPVILRRSGRLLVDSKLCAVSRQIRGEYLAALECAPEIETTIKRFDFRPIVAFLNRLSKEHAHNLSNSTTSPSKQTIAIYFEVPHTSTPLNDALLKRWLNRFKTADKRALQMNFSYEFCLERDYEITAEDQANSKLFLNELEIECTGRATEELHKIVAALADLYEGGTPGRYGSLWV
ncbi:hypothetical protein TI39_contig5867g00006 [Zymoseptoria brevis]|uniref:Uncharacterized protein n=1 Tax=Zymoseptoria brevis TaxID=1047168 RepID=A0A0F4G4P4_9PEZI|nr:hypothetical protein TI39_contig5867g00006 [Zymoseptoria brevis]